MAGQPLLWRTTSTLRRRSAPAWARATNLVAGPWCSLPQWALPLVTLPRGKAAAMSSTSPAVLAGPPPVIAQASLESEAFRIAALTPARGVADTKGARVGLWPVPQRRSGRYLSGQ